MLYIDLYLKGLWSALSVRSSKCMTQMLHCIVFSLQLIYDTNVTLHRLFIAANCMTQMLNCIVFLLQLIYDTHVTLHLLFIAANCMTQMLHFTVCTSQLH